MTGLDHDASKRRLLADFLRAKRALVKPEHVGLPTGSRRRTPGLRREELANIAGVGIAWYTALEQGRDVHPSDETLLKIAAGLRLSQAETQHLFFLSGRHLPVEFWKSSPSVAPGLRSLVDVLSPRPALIADQKWNWLAWNEAADYFFEFDPDRDLTPARNTLLETFTGKPRMPEADWEAYAQLLVGRLRASSHFSSENHWFEGFVRELSDTSERFRRIWNRFEVADISETKFDIYHSELGRVSMEMLVFPIPTMVGAWLTIFLIDESVLDRLVVKLPASRNQRRQTQG